jgi:hypothetical protein
MQVALDGTLGYLPVRDLHVQRPHGQGVTVQLVLGAGVVCIP